MSLKELQELIKKYGNVTWIELKDILKAKGYACYTGDVDA